MSSFAQASGYEFVTLVDRTGKGGCEIIHDGVRCVFPMGRAERPVPRFLVEWLYRVDQQKVHTVTGEYVQRFGIKEPNDELAAILGPEAFDCSPIEIDKERLEGWDTDAVPDRGPMKAINLGRQTLTNDAPTGGATFSGKERGK